MGTLQADWDLVLTLTLIALILWIIPKRLIIWLLRPLQMGSTWLEAICKSKRNMQIQAQWKRQKLTEISGKFAYVELIIPWWWKMDRWERKDSCKNWALPTSRLDLKNPLVLKKKVGHCWSSITLTTLGWRSRDDERWKRLYTSHGIESVMI